MLTRNLQDWSDDQPLLRLQKKATKPEHATGKRLYISGSWTAERLPLGRITTERSLVGRQHTEIQGVRSPLSYKTAIQMTFAMPKLRRLKSVVIGA
jgi:hypothetical protein